MTNVLDKIEDERIRRWYRNTTNLDFLNELVNRAEQIGYKLDTKSGLLIREIYFDEIIKIHSTAMDIIFPRPVDLHHHEDVDETLLILDGSGKLYRKKEEVFKESQLYFGQVATINRNVSHSFRPYKNGFLEVRLLCSGILDPSKEVCEERFDTFEKWVQYYL